MAWNIYRFGEKSHHGAGSDAEAFYEAAKMAKEGVATMMELAEEMEHKYGERYYGERGGYYGGREHEDWERDGMYGDRRRRDSMGRYM